MLFGHENNRITAEEFFCESPETYAEDKVFPNQIKDLPSDKREALPKLID